MLVELLDRNDNEVQLISMGKSPAFKINYILCLNGFAGFKLEAEIQHFSLLSLVKGFSPVAFVVAHWMWPSVVRSVGMSQCTDHTLDLQHCRNYTTGGQQKQVLQLQVQLSSCVFLTVSY